MIGDLARHSTAGYEAVNATAYDRSIGAARRSQALAIVETVRATGIKAAARWVDVGCGVGIVLAEAQRAGMQVVGLEPDPVACALAKASIEGLELYQSVLTEDAIADGHADVLSTLDVLEHVPAHGLQGFVRLVHAKLATDGIWVIKVPTSDGLAYRVAHAAARVPLGAVRNVVRRLWLTEYTYPHTVYFNAASLRRLVAANGFTVLGTSYLPEVTPSTAIERIRVDSTISRSQTVLALPVLVGISLVDRLRRKSDALVLVARKA